MPADGTTVIRIYGFDENAFSIGDIGVYLTESSNGGTPSTAYVSDVPFSTYSQGIPWGFTTYATLLSVDSGDFPPPGTEFVEFAFVPLTGGAPDPIDLAALPPEIKVLTNQYYSGGWSRSGPTYQANTPYWAHGSLARTIISECILWR